MLLGSNFFLYPTPFFIYSRPPPVKVKRGRSPLLNTPGITLRLLPIHNPFKVLVKRFYLYWVGGEGETVSPLLGVGKGNSRSGAYEGGMVG
jgi:hypothetical protein